MKEPAATMPALAVPVSPLPAGAPACHVTGSPTDADPLMPNRPLLCGLYSEQHQRWGMGLQDLCKRECGVSPKGLRDRAATVLRSHGLNETVAARLLGHTPSWVTASYGGVPWEKLVEAVALL